MQSPAVIEKLRAAITTARQLDSEVEAGADIDSEVDQLRQKIEVCENESEALALLKRLAPLEQTSKLRQIRKSRLESDSFAAWTHAVSFVLPAVDECAVLVGDACDECWQQFHDTMQSAIAPEIERLVGMNFDIIRAQRNRDIGSVASLGLAVAPAILQQQELGRVRSLLEYGRPRQSALNGLSLVENALSSLPEIKRQAAILKRACNAFASAIAADSRQVAA